MKSSVLIMLSVLLVTAILAPSIITLANSSEKSTVAIDFNEEEKKEITEKDFFLDSDTKLLTLLHLEKTSLSNFYIESDYSTSITIFLLPPEDNS